jgi:hypothetical protein
MVLLAWVAPSFDPAKHAVNLLDEDQLLVVTRGSPEHMDLAEARTGRVRTEYIADGKEKLADVAKKFGMGSHDLARINRISYDTVLAKGQTIIVYQVTDPGRSKRADEQWKKTPRSQRGKLAGAPAARTASTASEDEGGEDGDDAGGGAERAEPALDTRAPDRKTSDAGRGDARRTEAKRSDKDDSEPKRSEAKRREAKDPPSQPRVTEDAVDAGPVTKPGQLR